MAALWSYRWLAVGMLLVVRPATGMAQEAGKPVEFRHDFRGAKLNDRFKLFGPDAVDFVKEEPEGLRLTVPIDQKKPDRVGVRTTFGVRGDFTITAGFELLQADRPKAGAGVGFLLYLITEQPKETGFAFFRLRRVNEGDTYLLSRRTYIPNAKQRYDDEFVEASGESGRLRVTREGASIVVAVAEGKEDFRELRRYDFEDTDLKYVELTAYPGRAPNAVVVRVTDLQIRAESLPGLPIPPSDPPRPGVRAGVVLALVLVFVAAMVVVVLWNRRRRTTEPSLQTEATPVSFRCPACGKALKAKANRAGKAVVCPHCEQTVSIPGVGENAPHKR